MIERSWRSGIADGAAAAAAPGGDGQDRRPRRAGCLTRTMQHGEKHHVQNTHYIGRPVFEDRTSDRNRLYTRQPGRRIAEIRTSAEIVDGRAVDAARRAQFACRTAAIERAGYVKAIARRSAARSMFSPKRFPANRARSCPWPGARVLGMAGLMEYMADGGAVSRRVIASDQGRDDLPQSGAGRVVAGILPWNFPFYLIGRKLARRSLPAIRSSSSRARKRRSMRFSSPSWRHEVGLPKGCSTWFPGAGARPVPPCPVIRASSPSASPAACRRASPSWSGRRRISHG